MTSDRRIRARQSALFLLCWLILCFPGAVSAGHGLEDSIDTIPADRVKRLLDSGAKLVLIDLRPTKEFQENRLPGARSIPMTELGKRFEEIPKAGQVVLYCACTINEIADKAAFLEFRGYRNIFVLIEGFPGWVKRGYPLETGRR
jgi:rhodanese-related sulfurtransferase